MPEISKDQYFQKLEHKEQLELTEKEKRKEKKRKKKAKYKA